MSVPIFLAFLTGIGAGFGYFAGLLLTVRHVCSKRRPGLYLVGSFVFRAGAVLVLFFLVSDGHFARYIACITGFFVARQIMVFFINSVGMSRKGDLGGARWIL